MAIPYTYVSLLDVLGYRNKIDADRQAGSEDFKTKLESSLSVLSGINETEIGYQAISDTIIIASSQYASFCDLLDILKRVHLSFLENGLFLRGGVAFAPHFRSGPITYSHALPIAYQIEQKQAIYPRIVIDKNIVEMFSPGGKLESELGRVKSEKLICKENGIFFLNVAGGQEEKYYNLSRAIYEAEASALDGHEHELAKHRWLQEYICHLSERPLEKYIAPVTVFG